VDKQAEITETAGKIYDLLECRDCARIDFRMDVRDRLYFIEVNPLPGLAPGYSDYPMLAEFNGVGYNSLIQGIFASALERYGMSI
jgi:D-alanine-D-alanine ligase